jgi:hypothetical protein
LALSALIEIRPDHELEPGIVRWLMGQRRAQGWGSTNETAFAIIGLTDHLLATSFSEGAIATGYSVLLNGQPLASGALGPGEPAVSLEIAPSRLSVGANELRVEQNGAGRLYYAISSRIYLAQPAIESAGDVAVGRLYLDVASNRPITQTQAGQLVKVQMTVNMPARAAYVIVEDSLPGGLEALNEGLNTTSHQAMANEWDTPRYTWQQYGYNHKEIRADRVSFFITEMEIGRHVFTYYARASHTGDFTAMPVEVYAMYDLATWGRSATSNLVIAD